jgi:prepilin-type N-terminal cleavage/methylation domain-containing protein
MTQSALKSRQSEGGFTLVELAIVMVIIGLLIGGVLKGQALINNAKVSSSVTQLKSIDTGLNAFQDKFGALPGDLQSAGTRLPKCSNATNCNIAAADGDGLIEGPNDTGAVIITTTEATAVFPQLTAADMLSSTADGTQAYSTGAVTFPNFSLGGQMRLSYGDGTAQTGLIFATKQAGTFLAAGGLAGTAMGGANGTLSPSDLASIDRKIDDGRPNTGTVYAAGAAATCTATAAAGTGTGLNTDIYFESATAKTCGLFVKVLN